MKDRKRKNREEEKEARKSVDDKWRRVEKIKIRKEKRIEKKWRQQEV